MKSKDQEIFCKSWLPKPGVRIKAVVCFLQGCGDTCTFFFEGIAKRIAASGYGVYVIDHPGFGLSEGLHGYIPCRLEEWLQPLPSALVVGFVKTDIEFQQKGEVDASSNFTSVIGKWEFGFVYKAQMTTTVQTVAVKVLATDSKQGDKESIHKYLAISCIETKYKT
ncbi:hypothetical protein L2E82_50929 [Cichorium intybus]|nr:hypothetical protein L2E82_50929 [Cichorium intybus]